MKTYKDVQSLIGHTPLVELGHLDLGDDVHIFAKLESANPGGSIKDRVGVAMVQAAFEQGKLIKGGTIVEPTAGNTGIGIAMAALHQDVHVIFVVPEKFSLEKQVLMRALGAKIVHTPLEDGMRGAISKAKELVSEIPHAIMLNQFTNQANPGVHYATTGPEIYDDLDGQIDYFVAGAGTGGTYSGIMRYLKEQDSSIQGVLADPDGSIIGGGSHHDYVIEGIGNDFIPETMDLSLVDQVIKVKDRDALHATRMLAKQEGIIAGSSSGAGLYAALQLVKQGAKGNIVIMIPDRGDRYFSEHLLENKY